MSGRIFAGRGSGEVERLISAIPPLEGPPVGLSWRGGLRAHRGRLLSGPGPGDEVHAATFIRRREVVLDRELRKQPRELARIAVHEIFHFVWARLPNRVRHGWEALLKDELRTCARGELGWSSQWRKDRLGEEDLARRTRRWREYVCESFCDTAAWLYARVGEHEEFTLAAGRRRRRAAWFAAVSGHLKGGLRI
jgi:hypothetical protein